MDSKDKRASREIGEEGARARPTKAWNPLDDPREGVDEDRDEARGDGDADQDLAAGVVERDSNPWEGFAPTPWVMREWRVAKIVERLRARRQGRTPSAAATRITKEDIDELRAAIGLAELSESPAHQADDVQWLEAVRQVDARRHLEAASDEDLARRAAALRRRLRRY